MTSNCGKNKEVVHEAIAEFITDALITFSYFWSRQKMSQLIILILWIFYRRLVSSVGRVPVCCARVRASDRTNTQGLKITKENVLPL